MKEFFMRITKPYKVSVDKWMQVESSEGSIFDSNGRELIQIAIGEYVDKENPKNIEYIVETFYADLIHVILLDKNFKVYVQIGKSPQLFVTNNGNLIVHNDSIKSVSKEIKSVLKEMSWGKKIGAFENLKENQQVSGYKIDASTLEFVRQIKTKCNIDYPTQLIKAVLSEHILESFHLKEDRYEISLLSSLSNEEMENLCMDFFKNFRNENFTNEVLKELSESIPIEEIESFISKDILWRVMLGKIKLKNE